MDPERLAFFRTMLVHLRDGLNEAGPHRLDPNRVDSTGRRDDDHQPLNEMNQAIASSRNRARSADLSKIKAAIERLDREPEDFGLCLECDEPIPEKRLKLMPFAQYCVRCLSAQEDDRGGHRRKSLRDYI